MAGNCAKRALLSGFASRSTSSSSLPSSAAAKLGGFASAKRTSSCLPRHKPSFLSRLPVELGGAQSLMPLHSVTASALLTSMLSSKLGNWGWLSEALGYVVTVELCEILKRVKQPESTSFLVERFATTL